MSMERRVEEVQAAESSRQGGLEVAQCGAVPSQQVSQTWVCK